jgi:hypothetical protein
MNKLRNFTTTHIIIYIVHPPINRWILLGYAASVPP